MKKKTTVCLAVEFGWRKERVIMVCSVNESDIEDDTEYPAGIRLGEYVTTGKKVKYYDNDDDLTSYVEGHIVEKYQSSDT